MSERFTVAASSLPDWYQTWFSMPWARVYTLNVDDLAEAAQRRWPSLPKHFVSASALRANPGAQNDAVELVHLNGLASDGPDAVTFSTTQYAERLANQEPWYARLAVDLLTHPFIFVGTPLEENLFWQHLQLRRTRSAASEAELRPKSFLVSPTLSRGKENQLRVYNIEWVQATAEEFEAEVLSSLGTAASAGLAKRAADSIKGRDRFENIRDVAAAASEAASTRQTEYLLGDEPHWGDIRIGRAIEREEDGPRLAKLQTPATKRSKPSEPVPIVAIVGTAGSGKTTHLMRAALYVHAGGRSVAWVAAQAEVSPRTLSKYYAAAGHGQSVLVIDDADRYGRELLPLLLELTKAECLALVVIGLRSSHRRLLDGPNRTDVQLQVETIGPLTDRDIDSLLAVLDREKRLGELRELTKDDRRKAFRDRAERQILVAMLEATSGVRFEQKVLQEWARLEGDRARFIYALVALSSSMRYPISREEVMLAVRGTPDDLEAVNDLQRAHIVVLAEGKLRARHRLIAETLIAELSARGTMLGQLYSALAKAIAVGVHADTPRGARPMRVLKRLLNHAELLRVLDDVEAARLVYSELQTLLDWDYHYWLQRGCLELEAGDVRLAENFLGQARALNSTDVLVETAWAHMELRKAICNPTDRGAGTLVAGALDRLRSLITLRGRSDPYPYHVFGSQVLAWTGKAALRRDDQQRLVREARELVEQGRRHHPQNGTLRQLHTDLRKRELGASVR